MFRHYTTVFEDAVQQGAADAAKTLRAISGVKALEQTAKVENDKVTSYKVTVNITFAVEEK